MPRQILFIQGAGKAVHDDWDSKLVDSLRERLGDDFIVTYPRMPAEADPHFAPWKAALMAEFDRLDDGAVLIGHSVGGTVLLHTLADSLPHFRPGAIILIAPPFIGEGGWPSDDIRPRDRFELPEGTPVRLYHGQADDTVPAAHAALYANAIPKLQVIALPGRDHQLGNDLSEVARYIQALPVEQPA